MSRWLIAIAAGLIAIGVWRIPKSQDQLCYEASVAVAQSYRRLDDHEKRAGVEKAKEGKEWDQRLNLLGEVMAADVWKNAACNPPPWWKFWDRSVPR